MSFALFARRRAAEPATPKRVRTMLSGAMIFGGPAIALLLGGRVLDAGSLTIALALTPVVVAISAAALHPGLSDDIAGRLWPGLAAVAGLLLVLAQPNLSDARTDAALILAPVLTGLGAALFTIHASRAEPSQRSIPLALTGATTLFAITLAVAHSHLTFSVLAIACDGVLALLAALALVRLGATLWSSQFTWLPLLIVLEGLILIRPPLTARWIVGLVLLTASSIYMLLPAPDEPGTTFLR